MDLRSILVAALLAVAHAPAAAHPSQPLAPGVHEEVINGVRLWYRVAGRETGTPVVFLHGGPGQGSQTFARFAGPALERDQRMIYLDQRGSGRSEKHWKKEYSLDLLVDDLERLRRLWGVQRMDLIGHSFGTVLALEYAAKYPQHVSHLVLTGTVVDFAAAMDIHCTRLAKLDPASYAKAIEGRAADSKPRCNSFAAPRKFIDDAMYPDPAVMKLVDETDATDGMTNNGDIGAALFKQGLLDWRFERPERLTMPVLAVAGGSDFQAVVEPVREFIAKVPNGRLVEYEGRGHFMFAEEPERFARDVSAFLKAGR